MSSKSPRDPPGIVQYVIIIVLVAIIIIINLALLGPVMGTIDSGIQNNL